MRQPVLMPFPCHCPIFQLCSGHFLSLWSCNNPQKVSSHNILSRLLLGLCKFLASTAFLSRNSTGLQPVVSTPLFVSVSVCFKHNLIWWAPVMGRYLDQSLFIFPWRICFCRHLLYLPPKLYLVSHLICKESYWHRKIAINQTLHF